MGPARPACGIGCYRRSRIFSSAARAQLSSNLAPRAPLAPIAPIVSSPSLHTRADLLLVPAEIDVHLTFRPSPHHDAPLISTGIIARKCLTGARPVGQYP